MRIQCTFNLAPELHKQHSFAIDNLRAWQETEKSRGDDKDIALQRRSHFHRDIYLSGLYLHKVSADLPRLISEQYHVDGVSAARLMKQISLFDDTESDLAIEPGLATSHQGLEEAQWQELEAILASHREEVLKQQEASAQQEFQAQQSLYQSHFEKMQLNTTEAVGGLEASLCGKLTTELQEAINSADINRALTTLSEQIATVEHSNQKMLSALTQQIESMSASLPDNVLSAQDDRVPFTDIQTSIETNQKAIQQSILLLQQQLTSQFQAVADKLNQGLSVSGSQMGATELAESQLTSQLARASKVKSKGLW
ncbi:hypothetical protein AN944_01914 [Shewanella sp. P1-14-1]|uniref:hypothetical protein n=1 Tax=Shewanella sp. P1-14-1 TaxID=1723761 RepID=UPI0006D68472|nr:hypothetical protein [Shewanella sp. P1-14-1]KPZ71172.1 hypothetical protein AN944_01914 [Shewanella sp. P1-14-1]